ncbi:GAF domain-containing protein [Alteribacter natronophilus]|uniref:GAF domain-containing protein n=1 Tax=Alteribacter natronophilus TaxID=2583810 RepID=UPI00110D27AE|nr:GAF domain-containing protein [Alteribacter natronophilus]TMW71485.1 GAF domain-containing protein [Alteribacter natronophilus]
MSQSIALTVDDFPTLKKASYQLLQIMAEQLNVDTAYIVKRDEKEMTVLSSVNVAEELIPEKYAVAYAGTYCRLTIENRNALTISDLTKDELTSELEVTKQLNLKGFLGVTMRDGDGELFGTLCVMSKSEKTFTDKDKRLVQDFADVLSNLIDYDHTNRLVESIAVPIVPVTGNISVLSLQGIMDETRSRRVSEAVLAHCAEKKTLVFIFDLSGLVISDFHFPDSLLKIPDALRIMGVKPVYSGITPDIARKRAAMEALEYSGTKTFMSLEAALRSFGLKDEAEISG